MPYRMIPFVDGQFYHIYNRGVEKRRTFDTRKDYSRFLKIMKYYQIEGPKPKFSKYSSQSLTLDPTKKVVEVVAYCLMPNHFHLLIKQTKEGGITEFMRKVIDSYTKYYNTKYSRVGPLFQGQFKAVFVESDEQLLHLSRYIHLNPTTSLLVKKIDEWEWSSLKEYIENNGFCAKEDILNFFKSPQQYQQFIQDQADFLQSIELIHPQLIDNDIA